MSHKAEKEEVIDLVEGLYKDFADNLRHWLIGKCPTLPDPMIDHEDVVLDAFEALQKTELTKFREDPDSYEWPEKPTSLLFKICQNRLCNYVHRSEYIARAAVVAEDPDEDSSEFSNFQSDNDRFSDEETDTLIRIHLDHHCDLSERQRKLFRLKYDERYSDTEAGKVLEISQPTLRRERDRLCSVLAVFVSHSLRRAA